MSGLVRKEILLAAHEISREKGLHKERVIQAIEEGLAIVAQEKYGTEATLEVSIDRTTGEVTLFQVREVVEEPENHLREISLPDAHAHDASSALGNLLKTPLPPIKFDQLPPHVMRQTILRLIKQVGREKEYKEYKDRVEDIVSGTVKAIEHGNVIFDLGHAEGILLAKDAIPRERFKPDDRVRCYIREVIEDGSGYQIFLSRRHPGFMQALFAQEVPEIADGTIQIKALVRDPGSRAKMGVVSYDSSLDAIGSCVGQCGVRVQAVSQSLAGERVDIIPWSDDPYTFLVNALTPATVTKIIEGDEENSVKVVVPAEQLSLAVGRGGQNVALASKITGFDIKLLSEEEEASTRAASVQKTSRVFIEDLHIDEITARFLVNEGFESISDLASCDLSELEALENVSAEQARKIQESAQRAEEKQRTADKDAFSALGGDQKLLTLDERLTPAMLKTLAEKKICSQEDLAGLSEYELGDILGKALPPEIRGEVILKARGIALPEVTQNH